MFLKFTNKFNKDKKNIIFSFLLCACVVGGSGFYFSNVNKQFSTKEKDLKLNNSLNRVFPSHLNSNNTNFKFSPVSRKKRSLTQTENKPIITEVEQPKQSDTTKKTTTKEREIQNFLFEWINWDIGKIHERLSEEFEYNETIEGLQKFANNEVKFKIKFPAIGIKIVNTTITNKQGEKYIAYDYVNLQYVGFDTTTYKIDYNNVKKAPPPGLFDTNEWPNVTGTGENAKLKLDTFFPTKAIREAVATMLGNSNKNEYSLNEWHKEINRNALTLKLKNTLITDISEIFNPHLQWGFGVHFFNNLFSEEKGRNEKFIKYAGLFEIDVSHNKLIHFPKPYFVQMPALRIIKANNNEITTIGDFDSYEKEVNPDEIADAEIGIAVTTSTDDREKKKVGWFQRVYQLIKKHKDECPSYFKDFENYITEDIKGKINNKKSSILNDSIDQLKHNEYTKWFSTNPFIPFVAKTTYADAPNFNLHKKAATFMTTVDNAAKKQRKPKNFKSNKLNFNDLMYPIQASMYFLLFQNNKIDLLPAIKTEVNEVDFSHNNLRYIPPINLAPLPVNYMMYFNKIYRLIKANNLDINMEMIINFNFLHTPEHWKKSWEAGEPVSKHHSRPRFEEKKKKLVKLFSAITKGRLFDKKIFLPKASFSNNQITELLPSSHHTKNPDQWINYQKDKLNIEFKEIWPWNKLTTNDSHNYFTRLNWFGEGISFMSNTNKIDNWIHKHCIQTPTKILWRYYGASKYDPWKQLKEVLQKRIENQVLMDHVETTTVIDSNWEILAAWAGYWSTAVYECENQFNFVSTSTLLGNFDHISGLSRPIIQEEDVWNPNFNQNLNIQKDIEENKIIFNHQYGALDVIDNQEAEFDLKFDLTKKQPFTLLNSTVNNTNDTLNPWTFASVYKNNLSLYNNQLPYMMLRSFPQNYFRENESGILNVSLVDADTLGFGQETDLLNNKYKQMSVDKLLKIIYPEKNTTLATTTPTNTIKEQEFIDNFIGFLPWVNTNSKHKGIDFSIFENLDPSLKKLSLKIDFPLKNLKWKYNIDLIKKTSDHSFDVQNNEAWTINAEKAGKEAESIVLNTLQTKQVNSKHLIQNIEQFLPDNKLGIDIVNYIKSNKKSLQIIETDNEKGTLKIKIFIKFKEENIVVRKSVIVTISGFTIPKTSFIERKIDGTILLTTDTEKITDFFLTTKEKALEWISNNMVTSIIGIKLKNTIGNSEEQKTNGIISDATDIKKDGFYYLKELDNLKKIININVFDPTKGILGWIVNFPIAGDNIQKSYSLDSFRTWEMQLDDEKIESDNGIEYYKESENIKEALKITTYRLINSVNTQEKVKTKNTINTSYLGETTIANLVKENLISSSDEIKSISSDEVNKKLKVTVVINKKAGSLNGTDDIQIKNFVSSINLLESARKFVWKPKISQNNNVAYFKSENNKYTSKNPSEILKEIVTSPTSEGLKTFFKEYLTLLKYEMKDGKISEVPIADDEINNLEFGFTKELKTSKEDIEKYVIADDFNNILNISDLHIKYKIAKTPDIPLIKLIPSCSIKSIVTVETEKNNDHGNIQDNKENQEIQNTQKTQQITDDKIEEKPLVVDPKDSSIASIPEIKAESSATTIECKRPLVPLLPVTTFEYKTIKLKKIKARFNHYDTTVYTVANKPNNTSKKIWENGEYNPHILFENGKTKWSNLLPSKWKATLIELSKKANDAPVKKNTISENKDTIPDYAAYFNEYQQFINQIINTSTSNEVDQTHIILKDQNRIKVNDFIGEIIIPENAFEIFNYYSSKSSIEEYSVKTSNTQLPDSTSEKIFNSQDNIYKYPKEIKLYLSSLINKKIKDTTSPTDDSVIPLVSVISVATPPLSSSNSTPIIEIPITPIDPKSFIMNESKEIISNLQKEFKKFNISNLQNASKEWMKTLQKYYECSSSDETSKVKDNEIPQIVNEEVARISLTAEEIIEKLIQILIKPQYSNNFTTEWYKTKVSNSTSQHNLFKFTEFKISEEDFLKGTMKLQYKVEKLITNLDEETKQFKKVDISDSINIEDIAKLNFFPEWKNSKATKVNLISRGTELEKLRNEQLKGATIKQKLNNFSQLKVKDFYEALLKSAEESIAQEISLTNKIENQELVQWNFIDELGDPIKITQEEAKKITNSTINSQISYFTKKEFVVLDEALNKIYITKTFIKNKDSKSTTIPSHFFNKTSKWSKTENHFILSNGVSLEGFKFEDTIIQNNNENASTDTDDTSAISSTSVKDSDSHKLIITANTKKPRIIFSNEIEKKISETSTATETFVENLIQNSPNHSTSTEEPSSLKTDSNEITDFERYFKVSNKNSLLPSEIFQWLVQCANEPEIISYFLSSIYNIKTSHSDAENIKLGFSNALKEKIKKYLEQSENKKLIASISETSSENSNQDFIYFNDLKGEIEIIDHLNNITVTGIPTTNSPTQQPPAINSINETTIASFYKDLVEIKKKPIQQRRFKRSLASNNTTTVSNNSKNDLIIKEFKTKSFNIKINSAINYDKYGYYLEKVFWYFKNDLNKAKDLLSMDKYTNDPNALQLSISSINLDQISKKLFLNYSINTDNNTVTKDQQSGTIIITFQQSMLLEFLTLWLPTLLFLTLILFIFFFWSSKKYHQGKYCFIKSTIF